MFVSLLFAVTKYLRRINFREERLFFRLWFGVTQSMMAGKALCWQARVAHVLVDQETER